jgi:hypothetical protein
MTQRVPVTITIEVWLISTTINLKRLRKISIKPIKKILMTLQFYSTEAMSI